MDFWTQTRSLPSLSLRAARRAESEGWSGLAFSDSQNRSGDPYVAMAAAAIETDRIGLSTGVTNPYTRHPAVSASAVSCIQELSGGRASLGIGRGDSSLAHLGVAPTPLATFNAYLEDLAAYLRRIPVSISETPRDGFARVDDRVPLARMPEDSRIEWLSDRVPTVPLWVVASGPKVIRAAAAIADRIVLAVGADPDRVAWGIGEARAIRQDIPVGMYVNVLVGDDMDVLRSAAAGGVAGMARFGAMHGRAVGQMSNADRAALEAIPTQYDMTRHFNSTNDAAAMAPDFIDSYGILGPPSFVEERLIQLHELGIDRFHVLGASEDVERDSARALHRRLVEHLLPRLSTAG